MAISAVSTVVVVAVLFFAFCVTMARSGGGVRRMKIRTGIEIWEGSPGAGKSYCVTKRLVTQVLKERRPVYTNLPLRFKVLKEYLTLKHGSNIAARYVRKLDVDHFMRFLLRNQQLTDYCEKAAGRGIDRKAAEWEFIEKNGPHIEHGPQANWFPPTSVFQLDELHRWFPQRFQDSEPPELLTLLTMHRHHLFLMMVMSQERMQLSLPWRSNCVRLMRVTNKMDLPFMFGLKFPLPAFFVEEYPKAMININSRDIDPRVKPTDTALELPWLSGGTIWRLYDSFTHMGSQRELERKLKRVRRDIEGEHYKEPPMPRRRLSVVWPMLAIVSSGAAGVFATIALADSGRESSERPLAAPTTPPALPAPHPPALSRPRVEPGPAVIPGQGDKSAGPTSRPAEEQQSVFPWRVSSVSDVGAVVDGTYVRVGGYFNGFSLMASSADQGRTVWTDDSGVFVVGLGGGMPRKVDGLPGLGNTGAPSGIRGRPLPTTRPASSGSDGGAGSGPTTVPSSQPVH